jgi:hypothetical protein
MNAIVADAAHDRAFHSDVVTVPGNLIRARALVRAHPSKAAVDAQGLSKRYYGLFTPDSGRTRECPSLGGDRLGEIQPMPHSF